MRRVAALARESLAAHPLAWAIVCGAAARLVAATAGLSFHARDDYFHVLDPALRWIADPGFVWEATSLPGAGIRSHLVPRAVQGLILAARALGMTSPEAVLRFVYAGAGLYSLTVVPAVWLLAGRLLDERGQRLATWLAALHFAMPYAGTRLLIEAMAMPPLTVGLYFAASSRRRDLLWAGLFVGLACWFRFQVGFAALGLVVALVTRRTDAPPPAIGRIGALAVGGVAAIAIQGLYDLVTVGGFLAPVWNNIAVNFHPAPELSRSTPLAYVGFWLLLTVPPATFVLAAPLVAASRRLPLVTLTFLTFVVAHSLVPHKEDRFMLPVLPLFLILLAAALLLLEGDGARRWPRLARFWPATRGFLVAVHAPALAIAVTNQSQGNLREAISAIRQDSAATGVVSLGPELQTYFLGERSLPAERTSRVDGDWLATTLAAMSARGDAANRFLAFAPDGDRVALLLATEGLLCDEPQRLEGYWLDRLLSRVNPERNKRRAPVLLWRCERPALALR